MIKDTMVIQNGVCIGKFSIRNVSKIVGSIFSPFIPQLEYMSNDALMHTIKNAIEMVEEVQLTENVKKLAMYIRNVILKSDRESMLTFINNSYLTSEGMGLLRGFGLANYSASEGSKKVGAIISNPETTSMNKVKY